MVGSSAVDTLVPTCRCGLVFISYIHYIVSWKLRTLIVRVPACPNPYLNHVRINSSFFIGRLSRDLPRGAANVLFSKYIFSPLVAADQYQVKDPFSEDQLQKPVQYEPRSVISLIRRGSQTVMNHLQSCPPPQDKEGLGVFYM